MEQKHPLLSFEKLINFEKIIREISYICISLNKIKKRITLNRKYEIIITILILINTKI